MKKNKEINSKYKLFQKVVLLSESYANDNLLKGAIGTILEVYDEKNYEIEFCNEDGTTLYLDSFNESEIELFY